MPTLSVASKSGSKDRGRSETSANAKLSAKDWTMMGISTARPIALAMPTYDKIKSFVKCQQG
jgi:hypothetical protein